MERQNCLMMCQLYYALFFIIPIVVTFLQVKLPVIVKLHVAKLSTLYIYMVALSPNSSSWITFCESATCKVVYVVLMRRSRGGQAVQNPPPL